MEITFWLEGISRRMQMADFRHVNASCSQVFSGVEERLGSVTGLLTPPVAELLAEDREALMTLGELQRL